ncbi:response regulator [Paenibacillus tarimensis]|uniref:response regulator n=1 Tax=Paenibacillus tarimensis TaxID=416012 RepID=UPI001F3A3E2E|nr:response regulator [Paenibacillus tarimensis]MCF2943846.1 response regulator [Paenibacillus tarimensis]
MFRSIRSKVTAVVLLSTVLAMCSAGLANYYLARYKLTEQLESNSLSAVMDTARSLSNYLELQLVKGETIGRTDVIRHGTLEEKLAYLNAELKQDREAMVSAGIAQANGTLRLTDGNTRQLGPSSRFLKALGGIPSINDPVFDETGRYVINLYIPVKSASGQVNTLLFFSLDAKKLFGQQLQPINPQDPRRVILVDQDANVLYHSNPEFIRKRNYYNEYAADALQIKRQFAEPYGIVDLNLGYATKTFYSQIPGSSWLLAYSFTTEDFYLPLHGLFWTTLLAAAVSGVILFIIVYWTFHRFIMQRVRQIVTATDKVARGNFTLPAIEIQTMDELGQLAHSVNGMARSLRGMFEPFETFIHRNHYAMIVTDADYRISLFNSRAEEMLGYKAEAVVNRETPMLWLDPQELARRLDESRNLTDEELTPGAFFARIADQSPEEEEWTWIASDGRRIPVHVNVTEMTHPDGQTKGFVIVARDVTAYKETIVSRDQMLSIVDSAHDFIACLHADGAMFFINDAGMRFLGIEELTDWNRNLKQYISPESGCDLEEAFQSADRDGYWEHEVEYLSADGSVATMSQSLVVQQTEGEPYYFTIIRDMSEQKRFQQQLLEANQAKSMFLARMSHEIRTPLNGIIGLSHLMQRTPLTVTQRDYMQNIMESSDSLLRIINDILDFSKVEADQLSLSAAPFSLQQTIRRICGSASVLLGYKPVDILIDISPDLPAALVGDESRLNQVLMNLLSNAIKFTDQGTIRLGVSVTGHKEASVLLTFTVTDTGIGISEEQLQHLFQPFMQIDGSTSRKYGGTGLGLAITRQLVDRMGGELTVISRLDVGSEFRFTLPFGTAPDTTEMRLNRTGLDVLVVEDNAEARDNLASTAAGCSGRVMTANSWSEAFHKLRDSSPPDVLLLDMEAEDMFGEDTWFNMRRLTRQLKVSTVLYTSLNGRHAIEQLDEHWKPDAVLVKPLSPLALHQVLLTIEERRLNGEADIPLSDHAVPKLANAETRHILVVEDNLINQMVTRQLLEERGLRVTVAADGYEALELLKTELFDLTFMDMHMPGLDGIETARRIRALAEFDRMPIIALTADTTWEGREACLKSGMNDVLTKPLQPEILIQVVSRWLPGDGLPSEEVTLDQASAGKHHQMSPRFLNIQADPAIFNPAAALQLLDGKEELLLQLLASFRQQYSDASDRIESHLELQDLATARRLAHSLRGAAGSLAAGAVYRTAGRLETVIERQDTIFFPQLIQELRVDLATFDELIAKI